MELIELYKKVFRSCFAFAVYKKENIRKNIEEMLPLLRNFAESFLSENRYGIEEEDYLLLQQLLIEIMNDIMLGLENEDRVLLEDTVEFGLKEFLELFITDEQELMALREVCIDEEGNI